MNTQGGNNNPYNQDNEISLLNWDLREKNRDVFRFFKKMIAFRRTHPSLCRSRLNAILRRKMPTLGMSGSNSKSPRPVEGDAYARYRVRVEEMQSLRIIAQAARRMPVA